MRGKSAATGATRTRQIEPEAALTAYRKSLEESIEGIANRRKTRSQRAMLKITRTCRSATLESADGQVRIWSDLHLGHDNIIEYTKRPFADVEEMNEALWRAWEAAGEEDVHHLVVGDTAMGRALGDETWERIAALAGTRRTLVVGNHDLTGAGDLRAGGFDEYLSVLVAPGDPPLIMTHYPLGKVPAGHVNVHGHQHDAAPTRTPHINVSVEQTGYRPLELRDVRRLAAAITAGEYPPGRTTHERIEHIGGRRERSTGDG